MQLRTPCDRYDMEAEKQLEILCLQIKPLTKTKHSFSLANLAGILHNSFVL